MSNLRKIKTTFNNLKKNPRPILRNALVKDNKLYISDNDNSVKFKECFELNSGLHSIETLGLINRPIQDNQDDHLGHFASHLFNLPDGIEYQMVSSIETLESYLPYISNDATRLHLNCLAISKGFLVATNGHILKFKELNFKPENEYLFHIDGLKYLIKLCKIFKVKEIKLNYTESHVFFDGQDFTFSSKLIKREYPKFQAVIPSKFAHKCVITNWIDFKSYKKLFNQRSFSCELYSLEGKVFMRPSGEHKEQIWQLGEYDKLDAIPDFKIGFNACYLDNALNVKGTNSFIMKFNNELAPIQFNDGVIIMPLKL